jgi:hypothetical protein
VTRLAGLRSAGRYLSLAVCAGAVLGIAVRVAMRLVAWQSGVKASFSLGGSLEIVLFGTLVGAPAALLYWAGRHRFALPRWTAVAAALLLFAILALRPTPSARSALLATPDTPIATAAIFAAAFAVYGVALDLLWRPVSRRRREP